MTNELTMRNIAPPTTPSQPARSNGKTGRGERTAWWITFGVLTFTLIAMLTLWN